MNNPGLCRGEPPLIFSAMNTRIMRLTALLTLLSLFTHLLLLDRKGY